MKKTIILLAIAIFLISMVGGASQPKIKEVKEKHEPELFAIEGVSGVSADEKTNEIVVYIEKPEISKKVPKEIEGFPVRHEVTGRIQALQATAISEIITPYLAPPYPRTGINRPVFGGISVGNPYITAGTIGLVATLNNSGVPVILSNAHVLALNGNANFLPIGTPTLQPGPYDGGTSANAIGTLSKYIPIRFNGYWSNNYADAAISTLTVSGNQGAILDGNDIDFYTIRGTTDVVVGETVRKSGRTSRVTANTVSSTNAAVKVYYTYSKYAIFRDQILVNNQYPTFSQGGDSGSAVDKGGEFVGLLFAGSNTITVVSKAKYILGPLGISV